MLLILQLVYIYLTTKIRHSKFYQKYKENSDGLLPEIGIFNNATLHNRVTFKASTQSLWLVLDVTVVHSVHNQYQTCRAILKHSEGFENSKKSVFSRLDFDSGSLEC